MKKKLSLLLSVLILFSLFSACSKTEENDAIVGENNNIAIINSSSVNIDTVAVNLPSGSIVDKSQQKGEHILPKGETKYFPVAAGQGVKFSVIVTDSKGRETTSDEFTADFVDDIENNIINVVITDGKKKGKLNIQCDTSSAEQESQTDKPTE